MCKMLYQLTYLACSILSDTIFMSKQSSHINISNTDFDVITSLVSIEYGMYGCES
jgi:hypothetical protein